MESVFAGIEVGPPVEVFSLNKTYLADKALNKVNLGVGSESKDFQIWGEILTDGLDTNTSFS